MSVAEFREAACAGLQATLFNVVSHQFVWSCKMTISSMI